jgi:hypothetical protein
MEASSTTEFYIPGNRVGQELMGVQTIMYAIMVKMAQVLGLVKPNETQNKGIPKGENHLHCYTDIVGTSSVEEYLYAILPGMLGITN